MYWVGFIELTFSEWIVFIETLKVIGLGLANLIALRILVSFFRWIKLYSIPKKIIFAVLITLALHGGLYYHYCTKIYENEFLNAALRKSLESKIDDSEDYPYGTEGNNLTIDEYELITNLNWFPKISKEADSISFSYYRDGFLPDYSFNLVYYVPLESTVDTLSYIGDQFEKGRSYEIVNGKKKVNYFESLQ
ncbi:MAG: hypothetical protein Aureis2KO_13200 [Aureisphaera sp.]